MTNHGKGPNLAFRRSGAIRVHRTRGTVGASPWILYQWFFRCWPQLAREKLWETFVLGGRMCSGANFKLSLSPGQVLTVVQWVNPIVMLWSGENSRLHLPPQMRPVLLPGKGRLGPLRGAPRTPRLCTCARGFPLSDLSAPEAEVVYHRRWDQLPQKKNLGGVMVTRDRDHRS